MKKKVIAITGGIGSGKSTVASFLKKLGYPVYSCDAIYNEIYPSKEYQALLKATFPSLAATETVDRKALASLVFSNESELKKLNALSHQAIMSVLDDKIAASDSPLVFAEVPLLFESGFENCFDYILVVMRSLSDRLAAIFARDNLPMEQAMQRIENQFDYDAAVSSGRFDSLPYFLLQNDGDIFMLEEKTKIILQKISTQMKQ